MRIISIHLILKCLSALLIYITSLVPVASEFSASALSHAKEFRPWRHAVLGKLSSGR